jgi:8-oxo-dGTP diphosphatase
MDETWDSFLNRAFSKMELGDSKRPITPLLAVDIIIQCGGKIVLIRRKSPPFQEMYALPGGFVNIGESTEDAAIREAKEETGLDVEIIKIVGVYSKPSRDPRGPTVSICYLANGYGKLKGGSDALTAELIDSDRIPKLAFDHNKMVDDSNVNTC